VAGKSCLSLATRPSPRNPGQLAGAPTTLYGQGGADSFHVAVTESSGYQTLTLDGGPGASAVGVFDFSGAAVLHDNGPIVGEGELDVSYPDGASSRIFYQNLDQFLGGLPVTTS
jgi:hypothetical protein